jgi:hypothetical protein
LDAANSLEYDELSDIDWKSKSRESEQKILEWVQLGDYQPVCESIEQIKARKMIVFMRLVPSRPSGKSAVRPVQDHGVYATKWGSSWRGSGLRRRQTANRSYPVEVPYDGDLRQRKDDVGLEWDEYGSGLEQEEDDVVVEVLEESEDGSELEQEEAKNGPEDEDGIVEELLARYTA